MTGRAVTNEGHIVSADGPAKEGGRRMGCEERLHRFIRGMWGVVPEVVRAACAEVAVYIA